MILIGQYDSPFVRRIGIALTLYDLTFEHRPWSSWGDADKVGAFNPLMRVPTLLLDDGEVLIDSHCIIDYLDSLVPAERAMFPRLEPERRRAIKIAALACGLGDMCVSLFYEQKLHTEASTSLVTRRHAQARSTLASLDHDRAMRTTPYWFGGRISHADIAVACVLRFIREALPDLFDAALYPALAVHAQRLEALPAFELIQQAFIPPN